MSGREGIVRRSTVASASMHACERTVCSRMSLKFVAPHPSSPARAVCHASRDICHLRFAGSYLHEQIVPKTDIDGNFIKKKI